MKKLKGLLIAVILVIACCVPLCGCGSGNNLNVTNVEYDNEGLYTAGGGTLTTTVGNLDVDWVGGDVGIVYGDVTYPTVNEVTSREVEEGLKVRWYADTVSDTLYIRFAACGRWNIKGLKKDLTITLPRDSSMRELDIDAVSCNVDTVEAPFEIYDFDTVSCNVNVQSSVAQRIKIDDVSSNYSLKAGKLTSLDLDAVSCNADIYLPQGKGFYAEVDEVSSKLNSETEATRTKDSWFSGDKSARMNLDLVSSDVNVRVWDTTQG